MLIAIPGLRSDDAEGAMRRLGGGHVGRTWSTSATAATALASLLTGRYAEAHGLVKRSDQLASNVRTLARDLATAGRKTILRAGRAPHTGDKNLWAGYSDAGFATTGGFRPTAEHVLQATVDALTAAGDVPLFATVVLGDIIPPYLPRADAWRAHWPEDARPPWSALNGRQELQRQRSRNKPLTDEEHAYWRALRRGKVDEVLGALTPFLDAVAALPGQRTRVVIVGLGGVDPLEAPATSPDLRALQAPVVITGASPALLPTSPTDLTDLHATLRAMSGLPPSSAPGHRFDVTEGPRWTDAAYAVSSHRWDVMVTPKATLLGDRTTGSVSWVVPPADGAPTGAWTPRGDAPGAVP
ncbi:MAG: hypothetical protein QF464_20245, partial [Myxococcota bacterium]|nr:hypothetical protein [Myxococcota bacterium]